MEVKSKLSLSIILLSLFIVSVLVGIILFVTTADLDAVERKNGISPVFGILLMLLLLGYTSFLIIKRVSLIIISEHEIIVRKLFKKRIITEPEIASINFWGKSDQWFLLGQYAVSTFIHTKDGEVIVIPDLFYRNYAVIKQHIHRCFPGKTIAQVTKKTLHDVCPPSSNETRLVAGNPYTCFNSIILAIFFLALIFFLLLKTDTGSIFAIGITLPLLYLSLGTQMYFFIIADKDLVIKNHYFPWVRKFYQLDAITAVSFESPHRRSDALRIACKDFTSKQYGAGSLRNNHWALLRDHFEKHGISIAKFQ